MISELYERQGMNMMHTHRTKAYNMIKFGLVLFNFGLTSPMKKFMFHYNIDAQEGMRQG